MLIVDTHCHASPYWYEPVEVLLDQMSRNGVDKAVLIQIIGWHDNAYRIKCMRRFPGRFSVVALVDVGQPDAPAKLEEWVNRGAEGIRLRPTDRSPGSDPLAIWRKADELGVLVSCVGSTSQYATPVFEGIFQELPNLTIVIEHLGGIAMEMRGGPSGLFEAQEPAPLEETYNKDLSLAQYPNAYMKVPGLGEISTRAMPVRTPFPFEDAPPFIEMAMEAFGARRLM